MAVMTRSVPSFSIPFLFALLFFSGIQLYAQRTPKIKGNRKVTEVREELPPFRHLEVQADLDVQLEASGREGYHLKADENLVDVLRFEVRDSTLFITSFYRITGSKALEITVSFAELQSVTAAAGSVSNDTPFQADLLDLKAGEGTRLDMEFSASLCRVSLTGNAKADLRAEADSLAVTIAERADANIYTINEGLGVKLADQAALDLEGISRDAAMDVMGNARIKAEGLEVEKLQMTIGNSATARVLATSLLTLDASGGGKTYLYGSPQVQILGFADRAELHKEED